MIFKTFGLLVVVQLIASVAGQCSPKDYGDADEAFLFVTVFGRPNAHFPTDDQGLTNLCKKFGEQQMILKNFARRCLNAFSKQTVGLLLRGVNIELKRYCGKDRESFKVHNKCGQATITETKQCYGKLVRELKQTINAPQDSKIPLICCSTYNFQECLLKKMTASQSCTKQATDQFYRMAKGYTEDAKGLLCGGIEPGSARCVEAGKEFKKLAVSPIKSKSVLLAFLEITNTLS